MKDIKKKHWLVDLSLIVIIIVMGVFVFIELNRTFAFIRQQTNRTSEQPVDVSADLVPAEINPGQLVDQAVTRSDTPLALSTLGGDPVTLSDYSGAPMLVNFWATWCPPCLDEMPLIQDYAQRFEDQLVVLAINAGEDEVIVREFVNQYQFELNFVLDPTNSAARQFRIYGYPTTLFIDESGEVNGRHIGVLNANLLDRYLLQIGIGE